jgi:hypothetical protein
VLAAGCSLEPALVASRPTGKSEISLRFEGMESAQ